MLTVRVTAQAACGTHVALLKRALQELQDRRDIRACVEGSGIRDQGSGIRVRGSGIRDQGSCTAAGIVAGTVAGTVADTEAGAVYSGWYSGWHSGWHSGVYSWQSG